MATRIQAAMSEHELRERASVWLKNDPTFGRASRRLLRDLADVLQVKTIGAPTPIGLPALLIVPEGPIGMAGAGSGAPPVPIQPGVYEERELRRLVPGAGTHVVVEARGDEPRRILVPTRHGPFALPQVLVNQLDPGLMRVWLRPEWIWVASARHMTVPLEALTRLLAEATAEETGAPVAIVTLPETGGAHLEVWNAAAGRFGPPVALPPPVGHGSVAPWLPAGQSPPGRVVVVRPAHSWALPESVDPRLRFDRLVYLADGIPEEIPGALRALLDPATLRFGAVVPSVLVPPKPSRSPWRPAPRSGRGSFAVRELPSTPGAAPYGRAAARLFRDACHVTLDLDALRAQWSAWRRAPATSFLATFDTRVRERAHRWSRAVTNRRVGVAVSGGGACAFRVAALLERLAGAEVPVDVLAALSGGALVGAYYCADGLRGLDRAVASGLRFQLALPTVAVSTRTLQLLVDHDLGGMRVCETGVRFAAVTTELPPRGSPRAAVVEDGSLGEAVRASGTLPPVFGPTRRDGYGYTDGGAATIVPARFARDCGADLTIGCFVVPGIRYRNPRGLPLLALLASLPGAGRLLDFWAWYAFLWTTVSGRFAEEGDIHLEFDPQEVPFVESVLFANAHEIVATARGDDHVRIAAGEAARKWKAMPR